MTESVSTAPMTAVPSPAPGSALRPTAIPLVVVPGRYLHQPVSWFEPLDPASVFGRSAPLEIELGSGDGSFLIAWARRHPERNFLGVERLLGRIRKLDRKAQRAGLEHVRGLRIEASYCLEYLVPPGAASAIHVYFPDPWPKRRHHKNRLVNARFAELAARAVEPGGWLHLRTDNADYFAQMREVFDGAAGFEAGPVPVDLAGEPTDFERVFNAQGIPTLRASYRRLPGNPAEGSPRTAG